MSTRSRSTSAPTRFAARAITALGVTLALLLTTANLARAGLGNQPPPASADTTSTGYSGTAQVTFTVGGTPPVTTTHRVSVPAQCWWASAPGAYTDPNAILADYTSGALSDATYSAYAFTTWAPILSTLDHPSVNVHIIATPQSDFEQAAKAPASDKLAWYVGVCRSSASLADYCAFTGECNGNGMVFHAYPLGATPAPKIVPEDLAKVARDFLNVPLPTIDRNPKITNAGQATLVNLSTWFWVTDPTAVGAPTGQRTIRAQVDAVWAEVTATTTGLKLTSPAGSTTCTPAQAATPWHQGTPDNAACTVQFTKASVGPNYTNGYPVQAETVWNATWTGSDRSSGALAPLTRTTTTDVRVAEVQTIVTNVN